jgi:hypothetical protein
MLTTALTALTLLASPPLRAEVHLSYAMRDGGDAIRTQDDVTLELALEKAAATLTIAGTRSGADQELSTAPGARHTRWEGKADEVWTGTTRLDGDALLIHFDHAKGGAAERAVSFTWRCVHATEAVEKEQVALLRCEAATPIPWGPPGSPVPTVFRVPLRLATSSVVNTVLGQYPSGEHSTLSRPRGRPQR